VPSYLLRVWLPDRPGALGAVASRIGAVRGDVESIQVVERRDGVALDEIVVNLPSPDLVELMISEICEVDGAGVEDVREVGDPVGE
jgi:UTP:GlnB (protein PII) uridylyltransferase